MHRCRIYRKQAGLDKIAAQLKPGGLFLMGDTFPTESDLQSPQSLLNIADIYCRKIVTVLHTASSTG